ncbi:SsgA family sporulation/cell division regulator [Streptomyces sp. NPDC093089]|uniref:SsgA family sporulation/cell division regulator n=1 Tax=Streptomyces sp. NPDC093089 TaxID=3366024 RepID=UPI00382F80F7
MDGAVVERDLVMDLLLSPGHGVPVLTRLLYRADDPFAVRIVFHADAAAPVVWTFARELLLEGLFRAAGEGDVRVWPTATGAEHELNILLRSPDGDAFLRTRAATVSAFLGRTLDLVPPGTESDGTGLTRVLDALLNP